jgi:hypothetical protein
MPDFAAPDVTAELAQARREIRSLRAQYEEAVKRLHVAEGRVRAADRQAERYAGQILALRRSFSWRLTAPLRILRRKREMQRDV